MGSWTAARWPSALRAELEEEEEEEGVEVEATPWEDKTHYLLILQTYSGIPLIFTARAGSEI